MINRTVTNKLIKELYKDNILILMGARQVGKTTLLKYIKSHLEKETENVSFFTLEDMELLADLNKHPRNIFNYIDNEKQFLLIDEIQYLKNPSNFLKYIYDQYNTQIKLVVTGSSAFYIDKKFKDSLAGRKKIIHIHPFSFSEFLLAKDENILAKKISSHNLFDNFKKLHLLKPELNKIYTLLNEYSTFGGYPKIVLESDKQEKVEMLRELHLSLLKKDILNSGIKNDISFYALLKILATQSGELVNVNELANTLSISRTAVDNYLYILEKSFIIKTLPPFSNNIRKELTKMNKIYFQDTGYRNSILNSFEHLERRFDKGASLENLFFVLLQNLNINEINFWRTADKHEVDFIINRKYAFEIKFNAEKLNPTKYKMFTKNYPNIPFAGVSYKTNETFSITDFLC